MNLNGCCLKALPGGASMQIIHRLIMMSSPLKKDTGMWKMYVRWRYLTFLVILLVWS